MLVTLKRAEFLSLASVQAHGGLFWVSLELGGGWTLMLTAPVGPTTIFTWTRRKTSEYCIIRMQYDKSAIKVTRLRQTKITEAVLFQ